VKKNVGDSFKRTTKDPKTKNARSVQKFGISINKPQNIEYGNVGKKPPGELI